MTTFLAIRYVAFGLFILFAGLTGTLAALNIGFMGTGVVSLQPSVEALSIYLVAIPILNIVLILPIIGTELYRKGALTSRIWFELVWISVFFLAYLGGGIAATMMVPSAVCQAAGSMRMACVASMTLIAFAWTSAAAYLIYFFALLTYCILHTKPHFSIWSTTVADHPWQPQALLPVTSVHGSSESIDSRRTLTNVHPISFKGALSQEDSPDFEKNKVASYPVYPHQSTINGPATFGRGQRQNAGVNAINGAPAYVFPNPAAPQFYQNPGGRGDIESQSANDDPAAISRQAPWFNDEETPSPAVITHAQRVQQPVLSLYPAHVVNTGLTTKAPAKQPGVMVDLLRAAGLSNDSENGHRKSLSSNAAIKEDAGATRKSDHRRSRTFGGSSRRAKRSQPLRIPPPLDLSKLSNTAKADRR